MVETNFGAWLRSRRHLLDLTQQEFANQVGCARITVRRIESGALKPSRNLALVLLNKLGIPKDEQPAFLLFARGLAGIPSHRPKLAAVRPPTNLPVFLTTFVGREKEQIKIAELLGKHRLVTLTGAGGVGKTRLSVKVAERLLPDYKHGVWFVELASLSDPELLPQTITASLGLATQSNLPPIGMLVNFLRTKIILLVLDNCEHLVEAAARLAEMLTRICANVHVLATSREVLGITGEAVYRVPSLSLPSPRVPAFAASIIETESVRLFMERMQAALPGFVLTNENAPAVAQICSQLDGIPLAIELAAARARVLTVEQIAERLDDRFRLLTSGNRAALPRQQTLRAMIDWSYDLLSTPEQGLLMRLSVFAGGWTIEAAESVCSGGDGDDVLDLLTHLVNKSLVIADMDNGVAEPRYRMLETIRQYAHEKLSESDETSLVRDRHLQYFLNLAERAEPEFIGPDQVVWLERLNVELDNIHLALEWALKTDAESGLHLASALKVFWENCGYFRDACNWLTELLIQTDAIDTATRAKVLCTQSFMARCFADFKQARFLAEESLALCRASGDRNGQADSLLVLGQATSLHAEYDLGRSCLEESVALYQELGDKAGLAQALENRGYYINLQDFAQARSYLEESLALWRELGNISGISRNLNILGWRATMQGEYVLARAWLEESLEINRQFEKRPFWKVRMAFTLQRMGNLAFQQKKYEEARIHFEESLSITSEIGNTANSTWTLVCLGYAVLRQGDVTQARALFEESQRQFKETGTTDGVIFALEGLASLATMQRQPARALRLFAWADMMRQTIGASRPPVEQADVDHDLALIHTQLDEATFAAVQSEGRAMSMDDAIAHALELDPQTRICK